MFNLQEVGIQLGNSLLIYIYWQAISKAKWWPNLLTHICVIKSRCLKSVMWGAHDDAIKWKHFPRNRPFVRGIHRSPVNSPHKGQCRGALMFSLICVGINGWVNNLEAGDLRRYRAHYDVILVVYSEKLSKWYNNWCHHAKRRCITRYIYR